MLKRLLFGVLVVLSLEKCTFIQVVSSGSPTPLKALSEKIFHSPLVLKSSFLLHQKKDYYAIHIDEPGFYSLSVSKTKGFDLRLSILENTLHPLGISDDGYQNQGETLPLIFLQKKLYYIVIEHEENTLFTKEVGAESNYSLIVQPFIPRGIPSPFQLNRNPIPALEKIQVLQPDIPVYGFLNPNNDGFLPPLLKDFLGEVEKLKNTPVPHYLALYTFMAPNMLSRAHITLLGIQRAHISVMLLETSYFESMTQHRASLRQKEIPSLSNEQGKKTFFDVSLTPRKRYIIALVGSYKNPSSVADSGGSFDYRLLLHIKTSQL